MIWTALTDSLQLCHKKPHSLGAVSKGIDTVLFLCYNCINLINTVATLLCGKEALFL